VSFTEVKSQLKTKGNILKYAAAYENLKPIGNKICFHDGHLNIKECW
jgi:hypothetical protein